MLDAKCDRHAEALQSANSIKSLIENHRQTLVDLNKMILDLRRQTIKNSSKLMKNNTRGRGGVVNNVDYIIQETNKAKKKLHETNKKVKRIEDSKIKQNQNLEKLKEDLKELEEKYSIKASDFSKKKLKSMKTKYIRLMSKKHMIKTHIHSLNSIRER